MSERYTKVGNYYIRRPQAVPYQEPTFWQQVWDLCYEVIGGLVVLALLCVALWCWLVIAAAVQ